VTVLSRVERDGASHEQAVDDVIQAAMLQDVCNIYPTPRTLVLLSGDGNTNR
jgi:hypothetical protein